MSHPSYHAQLSHHSDSSGAAFCTDGGSEDDETEQYDVEADDDVNFEEAGLDCAASSVSCHLRQTGGGGAGGGAAPTYEIIDSSELLKHMDQRIARVEDVMKGVSKDILRVLLNHYKWDCDKLVEDFCDTNMERIFHNANISTPPSAAIANHASAASAAPAMSHKHPNRFGYVRPDAAAHSCDICALVVPRAKCLSLVCAHTYCEPCWVNYLTTKIMSYGHIEKICCPAHKCDHIVDEAMVHKLIRDDRVKAKYRKLLANVYVQCDSLLRWCPGIECSKAVHVGQAEPCRITCICKKEFCFSCGKDWHEPVRCEYLLKWIKKCEDDSETSHWIDANTKECPKCRVVIEKSGGCNHMICKNQGCRYEFCWVCLSAWEPHGSAWYSCNRYDEDEAKKARDAQDRSRGALQRYLFYCNRYLNHMQSLKLENKLYRRVHEVMDDMQQRGMAWIEVQFLLKAVDVLCNCRRTLMYTYVFAYYLRKNNESQIFETNQSDLEMETEKMSAYLERDITIPDEAPTDNASGDITEHFSKMKMDVQNLSTYCETRRVVLLNHVLEGYEKEYWVYDEPN